MEDEDCNKLVSKLIFEVSQRPVLYDPQNTLYKDNQARARAWQSIAEEMNMPVTNCQIKWGTLRRCLANARKRQKRRQSMGSKFIKKWRYQDEMSFLLPFIDSRELDAGAFMGHIKKAAKIPQIDDSADSRSHDLYISEEYEPSSDAEDPDLKPTSETLQHYFIDNADEHAEFQRYVERGIVKSFSDSYPKSPEDMYEEEDEVVMEHGEIEKAWPQTSRRHSNLDTRYQPLDYHAFDEMDTFFLSMSKTLKKLPKLDQITTRSKIYDIVTQAEVNWLRTKSDTSRKTVVATTVVTDE